MTIDGILVFLRNTEEQLIKTVENINNIKNKENIDIKEFNNIYNNLKESLSKFDSIYKVEDSDCDNDLINYLNNLQNNVNIFTNNFNIFSEQYNNMSIVDIDKIIMKDFFFTCFKRY